MNELTIMSQCFAQVRRAAKASPMYRKKFAGLPVETMMTREQFVERFRVQAAPVLQGEKLEKAIEVLCNIENCEDIASLGSLLS